MQVIENASLKRRTSLSVGGLASQLYLPGSIESLRTLLVALRARGSRPFLLGGGCNTLFAETFYRRPIVATGELRRVVRRGNRLWAEAGVRLENLVRYTIEEGLGGLELFKGIPGTVGGAVAMNAGGFGREFGELVRTLVAVDPASGELVELRGDEVRWRYRSAELQGLVVASIELDLVSESPELLRARAMEYVKRKARSQPLSSFSAGCVFKNPAGDHAARLIEVAGLKGARFGSALVSPQHANFIVNTDARAEAREVLGLIDYVRRKVRDHTGVELELELVVADDEAPASRGRQPASAPCRPPGGERAALRGHDAGGGAGGAVESKRIAG
jgi:UDP-N-acetylmuramate dehydrogenase